ncbi:MAG: hypothetical protein IT200_08625 [Thermoleophilia bacterium]|nr:hypothetical protein [Thermoleophilia bacterium]
MRLKHLTGSALVVVAACATTAAAAPSVVAQPAITGDVRYGETVKCSTGTWAGTPVSYTYEWIFNGSTRATGPTLRIADPYYRYGVPLSCRVTATDGTGAATAADSAGVTPQAGRSRVKIISVRTLTKGRIVIRGRILPQVAPPLVGLLGRTAGVTMVRKVGPNAITPLGDEVHPNAKGFFTVKGTDTAGAKRIRVHFNPENPQLWGSSDAVRRVVVTSGGRTGGGGGVVIG